MELELIKYIQTIQLRILTLAAESSAYENWSKDFAVQNVKEGWENSKPEGWEHEITLDELRDLEKETLYGLGFANWYNSGFLLVPIWIWNYIADGEKFTSIMGEEAVKGQDEIDLNHRFGSLAWGFQHSTEGEKV